jgi:hypothetical protein
MNDRTRHQPPATISSAALDSRRWSLDLLLRSLLKYQELMPAPSDLGFAKVLAGNG